MYSITCPSGNRQLLHALLFNYKNFNLNTSLKSFSVISCLVRGFFTVDRERCWLLLATGEYLKPTDHLRWHSPSSERLAMYTRLHNPTAPSPEAEFLILSQMVVSSVCLCFFNKSILTCAEDSSWRDPDLTRFRMISSTMFGKVSPSRSKRTQPIVQTVKNLHHKSIW